MNCPLCGKKLDIQLSPGATMFYLAKCWTCKKWASVHIAFSPEHTLAGHRTAAYKILADRLINPVHFIEQHFKVKKL